MMTPENIFQNMSQNLARRDGFALTLLISLFFAGCFGGPLSPGEIDPLDTSRPGISLGTIDDGQPQDGVTPTTDGEGDDDNPITAVLPEPGVKETEESAQIDYALYAPERFEAKGFDQCKATNRAYIHGDAWPFLSNGRVICDGEYKAYWRCKKRGGECSALKSLKEHCNLCWNRDIYEKTYKDKLQPDGSTKDTLSPYDGKSRPEDCFFRNLSDARDSRGPDSLKKCDFRKQYVDPSCNTEVALDPCPDPNAGWCHCARWYMVLYGSK